MLALVLAATFPTPVTLTRGMVITHSMRVAPKEYTFAVPQGETRAGDETIPTFTPALVIRGNGITVDFAGATLRGTDASALPDARRGLAIQVEGNDITLKNVEVHGYKVGLIGRHCHGLKVLDSDFSYNWKQHLGSTLEREDESDWQSYHHNEHDEWLRYGAGIYLSGCEEFAVKRVRIHGGQCGLMLNRSNHGSVIGNDFSFLTGQGLGLYRSCFNVVSNNRMDWCVRGFSYGVYNRGQDSSGILVFEQSSGNRFEGNSVTHGGDGFFLWAGQETMDSGKGGCNDNIVVGNDFSHSPCNGIEATFSRNIFRENRLLDCWHGVWGGYSFDSEFSRNLFGGDGQGIAIEHGQNNVIEGNRFWSCTDGIDIWADPNNDPNFGYRKRGDIDSHGLRIQGNSFGEAWRTSIHLRQTKDVQIVRNRFAPRGLTLWIPGLVSDPIVRDSVRIGEQADGQPNFVEQIRPAVEWRSFMKPDDLNPSGLPTKPNELDRVAYLNRFAVDWPDHPKGPFLAVDALRGQRYILVDEWGPYDFQRPILWPRQILVKKSDVERRRFEILGPAGRWRVVGSSGVSHLSATSGAMTTYLDADIDTAHTGTTSIELEYVGAATTDFRGVVTPAGRPVAFGFSKFRLPIVWNVSFYRWTESENSADPHAVPHDFDAVLKSPPIKHLTRDSLDFAGGSFVEGVPDNHYATEANGDFTAPPGDYLVELTTDDGARVWLDDKPLIEDAWHYQGPTLYSRRVHLTAGPHHLRVHHFQIDGYAALKVGLRPAR